MPTFNDFTFDDEPDYDITPEETLEQQSFEVPDPVDDNFDAIEPDNDGSFEDEPGAGDSYQGTDPTVFSEQDELTDEETAPSNPDPVSFGAADDPESLERDDDEATGDDEDDTSDVAQVDSSGSIYDAVYRGRYAEQGQDADEVTTKTPEQIETELPEKETDEAPTAYAATEEVVQEVDDEQLLNWYEQSLSLPEMKMEDRFFTQIYDFLSELQDDYGLGEAAEFNDINEAIADSTEFLGFLEPDEDDDLMGGEEDFNIMPTTLADFGDVAEGIDQSSFLNEFQYIGDDLI